MAFDLYRDFGDAILHFEESEGSQMFALLKKDILTLAIRGQFPSITEIEKAYGDPFWSNFHRIVTLEDLNSCEDFASDLECPKK